MSATVTGTPVVATFTAHGSGQTLTRAFTSTGGPIVVDIGWTPTGLAASITSVTYAGQALTATGTQRGSAQIGAQQWTRSASTPGSGNLVVVFAGSDGLPGGGAVVVIKELAGAAGTFNGDAGDDDDGTVPDPTLAGIVSETGDLVLAMCVAVNTLAESGVGHAEDGVATDNITMSSTHKAGAATVQVDWDQTTPEENWIICALNADQIAGAEIAVPVGSTPITGRTMTIGWSIGMPDQP